jgi:hypothetical protein
VPGLPTPVLRSLQGLAENSGRTVVVAGPPASGKSRLLEELETQLRAKGARVIHLRGSYRSRSIPYAALNGLRSENGSAPENSAASGADPPAGMVLPVPPVPFLSERLPQGRRSRGERGRTSFLGQPVRARSANEGDPDSFWERLLPEFVGPDGHPVAVLIEDGALFDSESRDFVVALTKRARFRPFLIALALDTTVAGFAPWEDAFLGRGDVDWVRIPHSLPDPREAHRLKAIYDDLPSITQRMVGYVALLGGSVGEVVLSRVARLAFPQLADAILPATSAGVVKVQDGKVVISHQAWIAPTEDLLPDKQRREMHLEIAEALSALSPEPNLARRIEVARHYLAWFPGPMALRYLLEAAEISLQLLAFDSAEELLADALTCLTSLPPAQRDPFAPELRFLHARALFAAGRPADAENELREGIDGAIRAQVGVDTVAEWLEPLILTMRVIGPRPSLATTVLELTDRCHDAGLVELEILFDALIAEFHFERNQAERAREESHRAALLSRQRPNQHVQALALLAVGLSRIEGNAEEQELAERFLRSARLLLARNRRWELDALAEDLEARLLEARGEFARAKEVRERSLPALQRARLPALEIYQQLGLVELLLNRENLRGLAVALDRARALTDLLHLAPPSPALLQFWLLEGRSLAVNDSIDAARERWMAIIELPASDAIPRIKAEALVRVALLEYATGRKDRGTEFASRLANPELRSALPTGWSTWLDQLDVWAKASDHGGGPLPPRNRPASPGEAEAREHVGGEAVEDRKSADDHEHDDDDPVEELGGDPAAERAPEMDVPSRHGH